MADVADLASREFAGRRAAACFSSHGKLNLMPDLRPIPSPSIDGTMVVAAAQENEAERAAKI